MKTLADLKREAMNYEWAMISNSWFKEVRPELNAFRQVEGVYTKNMAFYTEKNGITSLSYIDFPKAKNLKIETGTHVDQDGWMTNGYLVMFKGENEKDCTVTYFLRIK